MEWALANYLKDFTTMSYQLAGMQEAQAMEFSATDYSCLPEFPEEVSDDELHYCNGVDDAKSYMQGLIDRQQCCNSHYMRGWKNEMDNYFINEELFGKMLDNSLAKK